jgi:hypothetical protein
VSELGEWGVAVRCLRSWSSCRRAEGEPPVAACEVCTAGHPAAGPAHQYDRSCSTHAVCLLRVCRARRGCCAMRCTA